MYSDNYTISTRMIAFLKKISIDIFYTEGVFASSFFSPVIIQMVSKYNLKSIILNMFYYLFIHFFKIKLNLLSSSVMEIAFK